MATEEKVEVQQLSKEKVGGKEKARDGKEKAKAKAKATTDNHSTLQLRPSTTQHGKVQRMRIIGGGVKTIPKVVKTMLLLMTGKLSRRASITL